MMDDRRAAEILGGKATARNPIAPNMRLRQGQVRAIAADGTVTITLGGDDTPIAGVSCFDSYLPVAADGVWVAVNGTDLIVIGSVGAPRGPFAVASGLVSISGAAVGSGLQVNTAIAFPTGRFTQIPIVTATLQGTPAGAGFLVSRAVPTSITAGTVYLYNAGSAAATWTGMSVAWTAIQMTPTSAAG